MTRRITDTARESHEDPLKYFADALIRGPSASIEHFEAEGQREFVACDQIPAQAPPDAILLALGFTLGPASEDDPIFRDAALPPGWTKAATGHAMWSDIRDARGRVRCKVFYKAACYDRHANMSLVRRFDYSIYRDGSREDTYAAVVTDGGAVVVTLGEAPRDDIDGGERLRNECIAWLRGRYPDWDKDPLAYWD